MHLLRKILAVYVLLMVSVFVFLPISANAYSVNLSSFESGLGSTGRIYGSDLNPNNPFPYVFCLNESAQVYVPGNYYAQNVTLTGNELIAAWLMNNYGNKTFTAAGLNSVESGVIVQNAIWSVTNQKVAWTTGTYYNLAQSLIAAVPTTDLSYLQSSYARMNLFTDANFTNRVQDQIRTVPVPAAVWFLGSGLVGLIGIRRRFVS
jgi:hypothetical protein